VIYKIAHAATVCHCQAFKIRHERRQDKAKLTEKAEFIFINEHFERQF